MKFVEEMMSRMIWIYQFRKFGSQNFNLVVIQNTNAREISVAMKEFSLIFRQTVLFPFFPVSRLLKKLGKWIVTG